MGVVYQEEIECGVCWFDVQGFIDVLLGELGVYM